LVRWEPDTLETFLAHDREQNEIVDVDEISERCDENREPRGTSGLHRSRVYRTSIGIGRASFRHVRLHLVALAMIAACHRSSPVPPALASATARAPARFEIAEPIYDGGFKTG